MTHTDTPTLPADALRPIAVKALRKSFYIPQEIPLGPNQVSLLKPSIDICAYVNRYDVIEEGKITYVSMETEYLNYRGTALNTGRIQNLLESDYHLAFDESRRIWEHDDVDGALARLIDTRLMERSGDQHFNAIALRDFHGITILEDVGSVKHLASADPELVDQEIPVWVQVLVPPAISAHRLLYILPEVGPLITDLLALRIREYAQGMNIAQPPAPIQSIEVRL